ncbi:MAG: FAD-dependent oxidoreductase [Gemmataceae bacterium]|nr:FAD-dependent oxidoreductase [Gemmataceae bacterium]
MGPRGHAIVLGGGVIGAACAHFLQKAGWRVTVLDKGAFGRGCSHGNCGLVTPSHVLPLAAPGAMGGALRAMLRPNSPFAIKPRLDVGLWAWLLRFARRCNERDLLHAGRAIQALLQSSRKLYDELIAAEALDCEWDTRGLLFVLHSRHGMQHFAATDALLRKQFNQTAQRLDGDEVTAFEPALKSGLAGGFYYDSDAQLRPDRLMSSWKSRLATYGVQVLENCQATEFVADAGTARALRTSRGDLEADAFVVAAGAWTPLLNKELGCAIPIQPGKGYSITMARPARCPKVPLLFEEHRVGVTPFQSGYRLGSTMEFAGYDASLNRKRLNLLREGARHYLYEPECDPVEEEWFGWRPMTPDSLPIIDRSPALDNVVIAAGHNMLGLSMAPATGKLVAQMLSGAPTHLDPTPYRATRFR